MPKFLYHARSLQDGQQLKGILEAENSQTVASYLHSRNCLILEISKLPWYKDLHLKRRSKILKTSEIILLCKELAIMLEAGLTLLKALQILAETNSKSRSLLTKTIRQLEEGSSLALIWQQEKIFPAYLISSLQVAEHTGLLPQALEQSADYLEKQLRQRDKVKQLTFYPIMLLVMLNIILAVMFLQVIPTFKDVFQEMDLELPPLTRLLFFLSDCAVNTSWLLLPLLLMLLLALGTVRKSQLCRGFFRELLYKIPYCRNLWEKIWLVDFSAQLLLLYNAGIPLEENLKILQDGNPLPYFRRRLDSVSSALTRGQPFFAACSQSGIRETIFLQLLKVGEETGGLAQALLYSNKFLQNEVDKTINKLMISVEPCLILLVGLLVGLFIFALILPLFDIPAAIGV